MGFVAPPASDAGGGGPDAGPDAAPCIPSPIVAFDPDRFEAIVDRSLAQETVTAGNYDGDYGDAPGYVPPVVHALAAARCDESMATRAEQTLDYGKGLAAGFASTLDPEAIVATLGFIETYRLSPRADLASATAEILPILDDVLSLTDGYLPAALLVDASGDALPYGQTAATALIPILMLRYVEVVDPSDSARLEAALGAIDGIAREAWMEDVGYYRHNLGDDHLELYPNVAMMAAHTLAYRLSGDDVHLARAEGLYDAIQPLYLLGVGGFHSSYSSDAPDYVTLSSTNYLLMAMRFLQDETGDGRYRTTAVSQIAFVEEVLYDPATHIAYHDWENDGRADWWCAGCQFQHAYALLLWGE